MSDRNMEAERIVAAGGVRFLQFAALSAEGLVHGFSLRRGGVSPPPYNELNLGLHVGDDPDLVRENRRRLAAALGYAPENVVACRQVHGTTIRRVGAGEKGLGHADYADALPATDGLLTREPQVVLMAHAADCTLLFFYDPKTRCIGLAHAGWRGAVAGMGALMVEAMCQYGCQRENIRVVLSPSIGPCCYRVGEEVVEAVPPRFRSQVLRQVGQAYYLDLPGLQLLSLLETGIKESNLFRSKFCTHCRTDLFYSHRAAGGITGRMAGIIFLKW